jgi:predicted kinase
MPTAYILVGVPASGKSSWVRAQKWAKDCIEVSTDFHVEQYAKEQGKTYSEVFDEYMTTAIELMIADIHNAMEFGKDIIWDQTSTTVLSRKRKFKMLEGYKMIAVVFRTPHPEEHRRRLNSRPGKVIPETVLESMINMFEMPTEEEGFDEVWYAES